MSLSNLLDETIPAAPPLGSLDGLIARERRRQRARRVGAGFAGTAAVLALLLGDPAFVGGPGSPAGGGSTGEPSVTPVVSTEPPVERLELLSLLLRTRLSTVVPGAGFFSSDAAAPTLFQRSGSYFRDYDAIEALGTVAVGATPDAYGVVTGTLVRVLVLRPLAIGPPPTIGPLGGIFGGCGKLAPFMMPAEPDDPCEQQNGPGGSVISRAEHHRDGSFEFDAVAVFPDGSAIAAYAFGEDANAVLTADQLVQFAVVPAFVEGATPDPSRTALPPLPPDPAIGTEYAYEIFAHCQYDLIVMAGGTWRAREPYDHDINVSNIPGTIRLLDADTALFTVDQAFVDSDPDVITYQRTDEQIPLCG